MERTRQLLAELHSAGRTESFDALRHAAGDEKSGSFLVPCGRSPGSAGEAAIV